MFFKYFEILCLDFKTFCKDYKIWIFLNIWLFLHKINFQKLITKLCKKEKTYGLKFESNLLLKKPKDKRSLKVVFSS